ncbi:MAG: hypothetical protein LBI02_11685 [Opitutaceae bacterium]|jgi:outer membrane receptor protein involved in Fe transport|nr:hypothetical protein [Opitutaceae bacterium]
MKNKILMPLAALIAGHAFATASYSQTVPSTPAPEAAAPDTDASTADTPAADTPATDAPATPAAPASSTAPATSTASAASATPAASAALATPAAAAIDDADARRDSETVFLSPFAVNAARDTSWRASTTLIGNRTNQELSDVPLTVDALTSEFMKDLQLDTAEDAGKFVAGVTVLPRFEARTDDNRITYRGLAGTPTTSRNFFLWYVPVDSYNVERLDFNKGSNSLIFGNSAPGGQMTAFTKQPRHYTFSEVQGSYASYGSYRIQGDFNLAIGRKLAVRINAVDRSSKTYVDDNYQRLTAATVAVSYRPWKTTNLRLEIEDGSYKRHRAENALALLSTPATGRGFGASPRWYCTSDGEIIYRDASYQPAIDRGPAGGAALPLLDGMTQDISFKKPDGTYVTRTYHGLAKSTNVLGVGDRLDRPFYVITLGIEQQFGKLALEYAFNQQRQRQERNDVSFGTTGTPPQVSLDSAGRPFMDMDGGNTYKIFQNRVEAHRFTAAYPFEFGRWMRQYLVVNASYEQDRKHDRRFSLVNFAAPQNQSLSSNLVRVRAYLDDPEFGTTQFWTRLLPQNLQITDTFQAGLNEVYANTSPPYDYRTTRSLNATLTGQYFNGRLLSLLGAGHYDINRKIPVASIYTPNARGLYTLIGDPGRDPDKYTYDPAYDLSANTFLTGLTYKIRDTPAFSLNAYGVYSESFNWQSAQTFHGKSLGPITGDTREAGLKGDLFRKKLSFTLAFYRIRRENAAYTWTPDLLNFTQLEDLFNPNDIQPDDPAYFHVASGLNNERRTINSSENSEGLDLTLQMPRARGLQLRATFSFTRVSAARDFTQFSELLEAAKARTAAALAPGGDPALAESAASIASAENILLSNTKMTKIAGRRSAPCTASWVIDYQLPGRLKRVRVGANGTWLPDYNVAIFNGELYEGGGTHPVELYVIYEGRVLGRRCYFRLGVQNAFDLSTGNARYRATSVLSTNAAGQPNYLYRYTDPAIVSFRMSVKL